MGGSVLDLFAKLTLDSSQYDKGLNDAKEKSASFSKILKGIGQASAAAFAAVGTATLAIGKQAVDAYANYEQLYGGIQKLFGDEGSAIVAEYAEKAFLTSGKSINQYYDSVSQITASLKRSVGDDMEEVARVADIAMQAISDNINTFGSDAEFVENAIMGLSRNNYTMIDNLKLGYAGTAQGMLELINDSGILGKTLTSTSELAEVGFDKMILAIQKVQEEQGIAGTTAKEALHTIEGSAKATKSAWENVITAIGRGEGLEEAFSGLSTAIFGNGEEGTGFLSQIIPRIKTTMEAIGNAVTQAAPILAEKIPEVLKAVIPAIATTVANLTTTIVNFIGKNMPLLINAGINMLNWIANGILDNLPTIIEGALEMVNAFLGEIISNLPNILAVGIKIILSLLNGIINSIPKVINAFKDLISKAKQAFINFDWAGLGKNIIDGIVSGIKSLGSLIGNTLTNIASNAWSGVKSFFGISSPSKLMRDTVGKFIPLGMAEGIEDESGSVYKAIDDLNKGAMDSFDTVFDDISTQNASGLGNNVNFGGLTFNIYGAEGQDVEEIARAVRDIIVNEEERNRLVYA